MEEYHEIVINNLKNFAFRGGYGSAHELDFPRVVCETLTMLTAEFSQKIPLFWAMSSCDSSAPTLDKLGYKGYLPCPTRFMGLNQAKTLTLSSLIYLSPTYRGHLEDIIMLDNLNCLKMGLRYNFDCIEGMMNLLKISPNLEALFICFKEQLYEEAHGNRGSKI
ncbi:hypothetical protein ACJIZ3_016282 [Penstemon smallii]|uniref:Uncharacterized protein n=1 Tax=Penstemon smallii TaxID=265156 RepID=A0ABD3RPX8_9LAMI